MEHKAFTFATSGDAYNATQCLDLLAGNGHALVCADGVIGLSYTWPVAVTADPGNLHVYDGTDLSGLLDQYGAEAGKPVFSRAAIIQACAFAIANGQPLAIYCEPFAHEARALVADLPELVDAWAAELGEA